jgi:hypothetical protein
MIHALYTGLREIDCTLTSGESQLTRTVLQMNICTKRCISHCLFVISVLVHRHFQVHPKFSPALRRIPKLITITPMGLLYQSSEIPVTLKASQNTLRGFDTLLMLTLLSLHSTFPQTLLESSRDWNTYCWCNVRAIILMKRHADDTDLEVNNDYSQDHGESTLSSDIAKDNLDILQEVLHRD